MENISGANWHTSDEWARQVEAVDLEIIQLALLCKVRLLDMHELQRVLDNDPLLAGGDHAATFAKLRGLLFLHFEIESRLAGCSSEDEARSLVRLVHETLAHRLGRRLDALR